MIQPAKDATAAEWLEACAHPSTGIVSSLIPAGFASYVRILHPAYAHSQPDQSNRMPISWRELAASLGTDLQTLSQRFESGQSGNDVDDAVDGLERAPVFGTTPPAIVAALLPTLREATRTPDRCWFAVWEGWGACLLEYDGTPSTISLPWRRYHLLQGCIDDAIISLSDDRCRHQSANIWWPEDKSWCVAVEVDHRCTYVGGSNMCIEAIIQDSSLEAAPVLAIASTL
jgi:hypothetical protein